MNMPGSLRRALESIRRKLSSVLVEAPALATGFRLRSRHRKRSPQLDAYIAAVASAGVVVGAAVILLIPAFINGFPFVFADSGTYLQSAVWHTVPLDRPIFYGFFARLLHFKLSLWPIIAAQAIIVAIVIQTVARRLFDIHNVFGVFLIAVLLTTTTSLPWFVDWIMPDIFTSILFLSMLLLGMCWDRMTLPERYGAFVAIACCVTFHNGNLLIALGAVPIFAALAVLGWRPTGNVWIRFAAAAGAIALAVGALIFSNVVGHGRAVISPSSSTFMLARLLEDGPALIVLKTECLEARWKLCTELQDLTEYQETIGYRGGANGLSDYFLWNGPVERLGSFTAVEPEAAEVVAKALRSDPWHQAETSIAHAWHQFWRFSIGTDLPTFKADRPPTPAMRKVFGDAIVTEFRRSRQGQGAIDFRLLNAIQESVLALSATILLAAAVEGWRRDRRTLYVIVALGIFLAMNATVTGVLSSVTDRYQARVIWLVPLFACLVVFRWRYRLGGHRKMRFRNVVET
jgi:hypothetical protein